MTAPTTAAPSVLEPGDVLSGRYVLTAPVAAGGMGDVWQATDESCPAARLTGATNMTSTTSTTESSTGAAAFAAPAQVAPAPPPSAQKAGKGKGHGKWKGNLR